MKTRAAVARAPHSTPALETLDLEGPRPDEVLVRIESAGICRTDLEALHGDVPTPMPVVLGHEGAGIVEQVGSEVRNISVGDTVVLSAGAACGVCARCRAGHFAYCERHVELNFGAVRMDGSTALIDEAGKAVHSHFFAQSSWSQYAIAHQSNTVKVSSDLDPKVLGPFGCGIQTGAGAILNTLDVQAGSTVAVFGLGAVGLAGIMASVASGAAMVIAIDRNDAKLELARAIGATHLINSEDADPEQAIADISAGHGVNFSLEATGSTAVMKTAVNVLDETGHAAITGVAAPGTEFSLDLWKMLRGRTVHGTTLGDSVPQVTLPRLVELYRQGRFPVDKLITHYRLDQIAEAISDVDAGRAVKAVLHP